MKLFKQLLCNHLKHNLEFVENIHGDRIYMYDGRSIWKCPDCGKAIVRDELFKQGEVSDGYHTFNELYHHRAVLFSIICKMFPNKSWKSLQHEDGTMYDGMFIVGIDTPEGPATYHYNIDPYWDNEFKDIKILNKAPVWDGHTPSDAINRIKSLI